jgi:hypothetical protein
MFLINILYKTEIEMQIFRNFDYKQILIEQTL